MYCVSDARCKGPRLEVAASPAPPARSRAPSRTRHWRRLWPGPGRATREKRFGPARHSLLREAAAMLSRAAARARPAGARILRANTRALTNVCAMLSSRAAVGQAARWVVRRCPTARRHLPLSRRTGPLTEACHCAPRNLTEGKQAMADLHAAGSLRCWCPHDPASLGRVVMPVVERSQALEERVKDRTTGRNRKLWLASAGCIYGFQCTSFPARPGVWRQSHGEAGTSARLRQPCTLAVAVDHVPAGLLVRFE